MKANKAKSEVAPSNSFLRTIGEVRKGELVSEASKELAMLVKAVRDTGKSGEMTIKLKIRPSGEAMEIIGTVPAPKIPKREPKATTFFDGEDGELTRNNPAQAEMFNTIEGGASEQSASETQQPRAVNE